MFEFVRAWAVLASLYAGFILYSRGRYLMTLTRSMRWQYLFLSAQILTVVYSTVEVWVLRVPGGPRSFFSAFLQTLLCLYLYTNFPREFRHGLLHPNRKGRRRRNRRGADGSTGVRRNPSGAGPA